MVDRIIAKPLGLLPGMSWKCAMPGTLIAGLRRVPRPVKLASSGNCEACRYPAGPSAAFVRRHGDKPRAMTASSGTKEQRKSGMSGSLAESDHELKPQVIAAREVQDAPARGPIAAAVPVERCRGHAKMKAVADAAEDVGAVKWWLHRRPDP